jgi:hypothetical protein
MPQKMLIAGAVQAEQREDPRLLELEVEAFSQQVAYVLERPLDGRHKRRLIAA